jgi:hypothetical protein
MDEEEKNSAIMEELKIKLEKTIASLITKEEQEL